MSEPETGARIACVGEAMVELLLTPEAPDLARLGVAGDTLNTAIYLKRCAPALQVDYATRLGRDGFSDRIAEVMAEEGLGTGLVGRSDTRLPGLYAITTDAGGERSFSYWRDTSAAREMLEQRPTLAELAPARVIYTSAITLAILSPGARSSFLAWLPDWRRDGGRFVFDSNYRPRLWADPSQARAAVEAAWRQTDIALPSADDEQALFGDASAEAVRERLRRWGVRAGAVKRGAKGPLPFEDIATGPLAPAPRVVDSTAAGDSFNGGYLGALLSGASAAEALRAGHRLAATVVQHRGAIVPRAAMPGPEPA